MKLKDQRQQKRTRIIARRVAGKVGHGRDDGLKSAFEPGDRVTVHPCAVGDHRRVTIGEVVALADAESTEARRQGMVYVRLDRPSSLGGGMAGLEAANRFAGVQLFREHHLSKDRDSMSWAFTHIHGERLAAQAAAREQREIERQDREADRALVTILLHKRALLASGDVEATTSPQGTSPFEVPTDKERALLVRALYHPEDLTVDDDPAMPLDLREAERTEAGAGYELDLDAVQRVGVDWPVEEDRALLALANEKLERRDPCAARLLARW